MNQKQLILLVIIISASLILAFSLLFLVVHFFPEWIGIETSETELKEKGIKKVALPPLINQIYVSKEKIDEFQNSALINDVLNFRNDSLQKLIFTLNKQILDLYNKNTIFTDSIKKLSETDKSKLEQQKELNDSIRTLYSNLTKANNQVKLLEKRSEDYEKWLSRKYDSLETKNFTEFAKIYNNSNPNEIAKILEQIEERDAAFILKNMNKKKAGKILEAMQPERAAAILLLGADDR